MFACVGNPGHCVSFVNSEYREVSVTRITDTRAQTPKWHKENRKTDREPKENDHNHENHSNSGTLSRPEGDLHQSLYRTRSPHSQRYLVLVTRNSREGPLSTLRPLVHPYYYLHTFNNLSQKANEDTLATLHTLVNLRIFQGYLVNT